jgi:hypothetical protein
VGEVRRQLEQLFGVSLHAGRTHFVILARDIDRPALSMFTCCDIHLPEEKEARQDISELLWDALMQIQEPDAPYISFEAFLARSAAAAIAADAEERRGEHVPGADG